MEESLPRKLIQELIIVNSPRIGFHQMTPCSFLPLKPIIQENCDYLSVDGRLNWKFIVCKRCHFVLSNEKCNRRYIPIHLQLHHNITDTSQPKPGLVKPRIRPLKIKKIHLIPLCTNIAPLPIAVPIPPPSPKGTTGNLEYLKDSQNIPPVLQATVLATLEQSEPLHQFAKMAVDLADRFPNMDSKLQMKKRGRKRKMDKEFKYFLDVPKDHPDSPINIISAH